jgi:hypothetical protein
MSRRQVSHSDSDEEEDPQSTSPSLPMDSKDQIIAQQGKMIRELQIEFSGTLDALRTQLKDYIDESTRVQNYMLERIRELKEELALTRRPSASKRTTTQQSTIRSSLYTAGPKRPRKLAHEQT